MISGGNGRGDHRGKNAGGAVEGEADGLLKGLVDRLRGGTVSEGGEKPAGGRPYPEGEIDVPGLDVPEREE